MVFKMRSFSIQIMFQTKYRHISENISAFFLDPHSINDDVDNVLPYFLIPSFINGILNKLSAYLDIPKFITFLWPKYRQKHRGI